MAKKQIRVTPKRGEIYLVKFDPTTGAEIKKTRPALVIQNDIANAYSPITIVAAVTSKVGGMQYPTEVFVEKGEGGIKMDSIVLLNQLRSIDRSRIGKCLGTLKSETMEQVNRALEISVGLIIL